MPTPQHTHIYILCLWGEKRKGDLKEIYQGIINSYLWVELGILEIISHLTFSKLSIIFHDSHAWSCDASIIRKKLFLILAPVGF